MKKIKSLLFIPLICLMFSFVSTVCAASATVGFGGDSTVVVGNTITIKMYLSNISDTDGGIVSVGGNLNFDSEYLEYVSGTGISSPYMFQINTSANYIIAGLDTTLLNGITSQTNVFTFVFKAKKEGTTQVALTNAKLSDVSKKITATVSPKVITITGDGSKSSDSSLKCLSVDGYTLSPSFSSGTTSYTVSVPSDATTVKLSGETNDVNATVTGLGTINLTGDSTTAYVKVTAEDGTTKTYTINIVKQASSTNEKSSDATLKRLDASGYTLNPTFRSDVNNYSIKVKNNITGLNITAIPNSDKANVSITGNKNWKEGTNTVVIKVIAEDGTVNNYLLNVTRESSGDSPVSNPLSSDNYLKDLVINSSHEISQRFDPNISNYDVTVPNEVDKLDFKFVTSDSKAIVKVIGNENFKVGEVNTVQIEVTAEDGTKRIYTLNVNRTTDGSDNKLKDLVIGGVDLNPNFDPDVLEYEVKIDGDTDKLSINAIPENGDCTVEIIGNENLKEGSNTVLVKVTDKNDFTRYYTIDVQKEVGSSSFSWKWFGIIGGIIGLLLLLLLLLLLFKRRKKDEEKTIAPIIEVKPEFNFGSKNTSDDDVVHGNMNQNSNLKNDNGTNYDYEDEIPYDPYDEVVTKREIVDAINEAIETKDASKLKMLLEQDALNEKKKKMKEKERFLRDDDLMDDWR